ncbi:abnormal spindle-like microcephaly-associated protein homolog [Cydia pomonella]|uniref:abnormal spindle-like microcephaly-associated protein homolog n=1 Tax=Cydia pomonella TaxID=82600 RepID=UPI002ADE6A25|nr:abnormal spindle-like microcephaly-associated protein homolog [Cydia pomonella]
MYFEIDNTPEHIRRSRRTENIRKETPEEETPRLILAPFSRPPQVVFDNVLIGTTCERNLEVLNPLKHAQQVTLARSLPQGLQIHLPGDWLELEPETCYCLTMSWSPTQPTALRETIHFTNEKRGRYDVIVVLKSAMIIKGKNKPKSFRVSPAKKEKKPLKKSPVAIQKRKPEAIVHAVKRAAEVVQPCQYNKLKTYNKENISGIHEYTADSQLGRCPFDSFNSVDIHFNTSDIFSNMKKERMQQTYNASGYMNVTKEAPVSSNVLKPVNRQLSPGGDIFDKLSFTPLKTLKKSERLEQGPKIILSLNSDCEEDSLDDKENDENAGPHSIMFVTSSQPANKWLAPNQHQHPNHYLETATAIDKKIPNTSSPKELHSPNFSINTEFSRISDLSFCPQRFSTERKIVPKINNDTHEIIEYFDKVSSDTYTKESPNGAQDYPVFYMKDQIPTKCRQSLFIEKNNQRKEWDKNPCYPQKFETNVWRHEPRKFETNAWRSEPRTYTKPQSPPRSITPPLQSIPEESQNHNSDTQILDKTDKQMTTFTVNRTFNATRDRNSISTARQIAWSKKDVRADPTLWKVPVSLPERRAKTCRPSISRPSLSKPANTTFDKSINQNILLNLVENVYSQSLTVDPFLSSTYFYDEEAVAKFEKEFKRWLNYILTPPADLDCNVEQKIDVGKAWIDNRNKEVPLAPTREQVSSAYHNSHRLESLRRAAKALLLSPDVCQVFQKLTVQIEKKLIMIRIDRNLHLDVGLQKAIMEILLCYNPLWLRIGLEALYCLVLPLKSNSDIDGLTTFIIQRMFKNPFLKNKHSKTSAPNMLLPAYMEAIKKFTLKKFLMLVYFLDQAKERKLIPHDPCLFRRNAIYKESREILLRFTRDMIAGIGDITKHLRPLGYMVYHKQTYLDEYLYAVHNIAVDIRDGVRLTKVMEIILMKNGLLNQLRTPAISRLQKIHNVQVALNALKDANFVIVGEITATDIADGHREKTMSLLWQLIHVFRAPLFETAANVIQTWWKKKYKVIVEKRMAEERERQRLDNAARTIQCWWQRIQYNRLVEKQMQLYTASTVIIQKYCRRWLCRTRLLKFKTSVLRIEEWYRGNKMMNEAKEILQKLRSEREELRTNSAIEIQRNFRRWLCVTKYQKTLKNIVLIQSLVRRYLARKRYLRTRKAAILIQQRFRSKLLMKEEMKKLALQKHCAIVIQKQYKMIRQQRIYQKLKSAVQTIERYYKAMTQKRQEREHYLRLKNAAIKAQAMYRGRLVRREFTRQMSLLVTLQRRIRAHQLMKKEKSQFANIKKAACILQQRFMAYLIMKETRQVYITQRQSAITIQTHFRAYVIGKTEKKAYMKMRSAAIVLQRRYRSLLLMREEKTAFIKLKTSAICIQRRYRALMEMRKCKTCYQKLHVATILIQRKYRARLQMKIDKSEFVKLKAASIIIQNRYRALVVGRQQREQFQKEKMAAIKLQNWFRNCRNSKEIQQHYQQSKQACVTIQRIYRAYVLGIKQRREYLRIKTATISIQNYYRSYIEMKAVREQFIKLKASTVTIQSFYRGHLETKKQREDYLRRREAAIVIQDFYRRYKQTVITRQQYCALRNNAIYVQRRYRSLLTMRKIQSDYENLRTSAIVVQQKYRALIAMRSERSFYMKLKSAALVLQTRYRAQLAMKSEKLRYASILKATLYIQRLYRAHLEGRGQINQYLRLRQAIILIQQKYKALLAMRRCRTCYLQTKSAAICIQRRYRSRCLMLQEKSAFRRTLSACVTIQRYFKAYIAGKKQRLTYETQKAAAIILQRRYRSIRETREFRNQYLRLKQVVITVQRRFRANLAARGIRREFLRVRQSATKIQSTFRMYSARKKWLVLKNAAVTIQRFYKAYKHARNTREQYLRIRSIIIKLQALAKRVIVRKRYLDHLQRILTQRREAAVICIQSNFRRYLIQSRYLNYRNHVIYVQRLWRGKLLTRKMRCDFVQKRLFVTKLQAVIRGHLVRKQVSLKRENLLRIREEQRQHWAASKIQAVFRGHLERSRSAPHNPRVAALRRRWREGALRSTQDTLEERYDQAMEVLNNFADMESIIIAFRSLELLTEVFPMMYNETAPKVVRCVYNYMSVMNRSISSVEVLKSAASVLANLTRYRVTGPKIYTREHIPPLLKYMWRFSTSEVQLFLILSTYLWLFSKYDGVREDLTEYLHTPENQKMMESIKRNVDRVKRMASNVIKHKPTTPAKFNPSASFSHNTILLPALEPDYGIARVDHHRYFVDTRQAIHCLFRTYKL